MKMRRYEASLSGDGSSPGSNPWYRWLLRWAVIAVGVLLSAALAPGIAFESWGSFILVVIVLSLLNLFVKPVLVLFTLPFVVLTFGLGLILINALLLYFAGQLVPGFAVVGFWNSVLGGLVVSLTSLAANFLLGRSRLSRPGGQVRSGTMRISRRHPRGGTGSGKDDDAIDI